MNNQEVEEEVEEVAEVEHEQVEADAISVIGTSQLLFDIVTEEENHDLDTLVTSTVISFFLVLVFGFWFWFWIGRFPFDLDRSYQFQILVTNSSDF